jgi:hypothetical protein
MSHDLVAAYDGADADARACRQETRPASDPQ